MATIKKAQDGKRIDSKKYLEESRKRVKAVTDSARKEEMKKGINTYDDYLKSKVKEKPKAKDGKWIQKAINPKHKGYCTPQTKKTCTPKRKALAQTLRKIAKKK